MNNIKDIVDYTIRDVLEYFLFEHNGEEMWTAMTAIMEARLGQLQAEGKLYDFAVICDDTNNSSMSSKLSCDVAVKYEKDGEFKFHNASIGEEGEVTNAAVIAYERAMGVV